jgi:hypothetical protein
MAHKNKITSEETRKKIAIKSKEYWENADNKQTQSEKRKNFLSNNPDHLKSMTLNLTSKVECEFCGIYTNNGNYKRWHGLKCKKLKVNK